MMEKIDSATFLLHWKINNLICFDCRYSDVTEDGKFKSEVGSGRARFLTVADQVIFLSLTLSLA